MLTETWNVQLMLLGVMDILHLKFILKRKSQVSQILGHHVHIWERVLKGE
jgi:hypothetical protein